MDYSHRNKTIIIPLIALLLIAIIYWIFARPGQGHVTEIIQQSNHPAYQIGKAFEVIESEKPTNDLSGKTPEQLIAEAEQIKLSASQIIENNPIPEAETTAEQKQIINQRVELIEQKIHELSKQLE